jgi:hypothetical protein
MAFVPANKFVAHACEKGFGCGDDVRRGQQICRARVRGGLGVLLADALTVSQSPVINRCRLQTRLLLRPGNSMGAHALIWQPTRQKIHPRCFLGNPPLPRLSYALYQFIRTTTISRVVYAVGKNNLDRKREKP